MQYLDKVPAWESELQSHPLPRRPPPSIQEVPTASTTSLASTTSSNNGNSSVNMSSSSTSTKEERERALALNNEYVSALETQLHGLRAQWERAKKAFADLQHDGGALLQHLQPPSSSNSSTSSSQAQASTTTPTSTCAPTSPLAGALGHQQTHGSPCASHVPQAGSHPNEPCACVSCGANRLLGRIDFAPCVKHVLEYRQLVCALKFAYYDWCNYIEYSKRPIE